MALMREAVLLAPQDEDHFQTFWLCEEMLNKEWSRPSEDRIM